MFITTPLHAGEWTCIQGDCVNGSGIGFDYDDMYQYEGMWLNGLPNGQGKLSTPDMVMYEGNFRNDAYDGFGTYYYPDGARHVGTFRNNNRQGPGTEYAADGSILEDGIWENGDLVESYGDYQPTNPVGMPLPGPATQPAPATRTDEPDSSYFFRISNLDMADGSALDVDYYDGEGTDLMTSTIAHQPHPRWKMPENFGQLWRFSRIGYLQSAGNNAVDGRFEIYHQHFGPKLYLTYDDRTSDRVFMAATPSDNQSHLWDLELQSDGTVKVTNVSGRLNNQPVVLFYDKKNGEAFANTWLPGQTKNARWILRRAGLINNFVFENEFPGQYLLQDPSSGKYASRTSHVMGDICCSSRLELSDSRDTYFSFEMNLDGTYSVTITQSESVARLRTYMDRWEGPFENLLDVDPRDIFRTRYVEQVQHPDNFSWILRGNGSSRDLVTPLWNGRSDSLTIGRSGLIGIESFSDAVPTKWVLVRQ